MARFTKEIRQEIVRDFCLRNGGVFDPAAFYAEVEKMGRKHSAYEWFRWNDKEAAREHRVWQAREFAVGLRVVFTIEEVGRKGSIRVREIEAPLVISPVHGRRDGGGYQLFDPANPEHMRELCRQAATDLRRWYSRYGVALSHVGGSALPFEKVLKALEVTSSEDGEGQKAA